jgi:hypothetical protein
MGGKIMIEETKVTMHNGTVITRDTEISFDEANEYIKNIQAKFNKSLKWITMEAQGDYVYCSYELNGIPFEKIKRVGR